MKIGILSRGPQLYSTQSLLDAGETRGHDMFIIDHMRCNLVMKTGEGEIYYDDQPLPLLDVVIPRIGASVTSQGAAVISQFEMMGVFTVALSDALLRSRDKLRCLQKLAFNGIPVPHSVFIGDNTNIPAMIEAVNGLPVILKLLESTHGAGVMLCNTTQSITSTIEAFQRLHQRVLMQEFIHEAEGADIRALVVAGEVVATMKRQAREGEFRSNLHRGASATEETLSQDEEELVKKAVHIMGLSVAGVDFLRSNRGPLIMEVNASPGLEGIEQITGVDVAGKIIEFAVKRVQNWRRK